MLALRHSSLRVQLTSVSAIAFTLFHSFSFLSVLESTPNSTNRIYILHQRRTLGGTHPLLRMALWRLFVTLKQCLMGTHPLLRRGLGRPFVTSKQCLVGTHPLLRRGLGRLFILHYEHSFSRRPRAIGLSS